VEAGKSAGGNSYGYRVVRQVGPDGGVTTGDREIKPAEAAVIERIFRDYAAGVSPRRIAMRLNAEGIPAPRGGKWSSSTINGNRARGTGILNNTLYIGQVVWNRLGYTKDPDTGRRRSRPHPDKELITKDAPGSSRRSCGTGPRLARPGSITGVQASGHQPSLERSPSGRSNGRATCSRG
jgi:site-specific DNA recombinase